MKPGWAAGSVRSQALARRRYGAAAAGALAGERSLPDALVRLVRSPYGHDVRVGQSLVLAQHAVAATALWHLRVLAGWVPWDGTRLLRAVAAGYEVANIDAVLRGPAGTDDTGAPYELGALGTLGTGLGPRLGPPLGRGSPPEAVRAALAGSAWGDPGADSPFAVGVHLRLVWARRCAAELPVAWVAGAVALLVARERLLAGRALPVPARRLARSFVGDRSPVATTFGELVSGLPRAAAWPFAASNDEASLWRAERAWWRRVEDDGLRELRAGRLDRSALVGACAVLAVDAWRVRAALGAAARGGSPPGGLRCRGVRRSCRCGWSGSRSWRPGPACATCSCGSPTPGRSTWTRCRVRTAVPGAWRRSPVARWSPCCPPSPSTSPRWSPRIAPSSRPANGRCNGSPPEPSNGTAWRR